MHSRRRGFTMIEMLIVVVIGAILTSMAVRGFSGLQGKMAARQARQVFAGMHARTRAQAIEFGQTTKLNVNFDVDSVWISRGTTVLEVIPFRQNLGADISGGSGTLKLCMNSRGFADTSCNTFTTTQTLVFTVGSDTAGVTLQTLGQLKY